MESLVGFSFWLAKDLFFSNRILVLLVFIFSSCAGISTSHLPTTDQSEKVSLSITLNDSVFDSLEKNWISSLYFDRGMKYKNSRLEVVSLSRLLGKYGVGKNLDAIILNCADDYQGIISVDDIQRYDLQLALKIDLAQGSVRPDWLQPLLIVVPDNMKPPFLERFLTANISELRFVRLADYYAPLEKLSLTSDFAKLGLNVFKNNCLFCHSINNVGGNKGGSLLDKFDLSLDMEKLRFKETFLITHGVNNENKQNTNQFLTDDHLDALLQFLYEIAAGE